MIFFTGSSGSKGVAGSARGTGRNRQESAAGARKNFAGGWRRGEERQYRAVQAQTVLEPRGLDYQGRRGAEPASEWTRMARVLLRT